MTNRFRELDGLRGVAALAVVASHFTGGFNSRYVDAPTASFDFEAGAFGVQLFFIISGFVILLSARRATRPSDFVISRVSRLYPAYWLSILVTLVVIWAFSWQFFHLQTWEVLANFTMVQRWFLVPNLNEVYWTLAVEMQFYVVVLALLWLTRCNLSDRVITYLSVAWLTISAAVGIYAHPFASGVNPQLVDLPIRLLLNATLAEYGPLFVFGMLLFISRSNGRMHFALPIAAFVSILNAWLLHAVLDATIVAGIIAVFLLVAFRKRTRILLAPPLLWFGKISYSLYIIHLIPGDIVIDLTRNYLGRDGAMIAALLVTTLLAWALHTVGEQIASRRFKELLEKWRTQMDSSRRLLPNRLKQRGPDEKDPN